MSQETFPIESSLRGDNTFYVSCEHRKCQQNYAICLNTIKAHSEGRRKPSDYCSKEISLKVCEAVALRDREMDAGHALYYIPRAAVNVPKAESKVYGVRPKSTLQPVIPTKRTYDHPDSGKKDKSPVTVNKAKKPINDISDVINNAIADHVAGA